MRFHKKMIVLSGYKMYKWFFNSDSQFTESFKHLCQKHKDEIFQMRCCRGTTMCQTLGEMRPDGRDPRKVVLRFRPTTRKRARTAPTLRRGRILVQKVSSSLPRSQKKRN